MSEKKAKEARKEAQQPKTLLKMEVEVVLVNGQPAAMVKNFPSDFHQAMEAMGMATTAIAAHFAQEARKGNLNEQLQSAKGNIILARPGAFPGSGRPQ